MSKRASLAAAFAAKGTAKANGRPGEQGKYNGGAVNPGKSDWRSLRRAAEAHVDRRGSGRPSVTGGLHQPTDDNRRASESEPAHGNCQFGA